MRIKWYFFLKMSFRALIMRFILQKILRLLEVEILENMMKSVFSKKRFLSF